MEILEAIKPKLWPICQAALIFFIGMIVIAILIKVEKRALKRSTLDESLYMFITRATKVACYIALIIMTLQRLGVSTSSLIAMLGAAGAAIALALKDSLANVAGGIIIIVTKPFRKGDTIEVIGSNDVVGIVDGIDLMTTRLHTFDNKIMTIPNGTVTSSIVTNYSHADIRRVDCQYGVSYGTDIGVAKAHLAKVAKSDVRILDNPEPVIGVAKQGNSAVLIDLKVWCKTDDYLDVQYYLNEAVKDEFDKANIDIPFPQMDVNLKQ